MIGDVANIYNRQLILALYVLSGVLTKKQLIELQKTNPYLNPDWQEIVKQINEFKRGKK